jgi:hypothetical protein
MLSAAPTQHMHNICTVLPHLLQQYLQVQTECDEFFGVRQGRLEA